MADLEVDFELNPLPEMEADFEIVVLNNEHDLLIHRDYENQHPISAITGLTEALASGVASVEAEAQARQEADSALQTAIDNETSRATGAESQLSSDITAERQRALQAESVLDTKIEAETARAEGAESALNLAITAEQTARENADESLQDKIDEEELRATTAESALNTAISNEVTRATSKENSLETAINSEISAREQADTTLQENITAEETRAKGVENGLRADLTSEIIARQTADNGLSADILAEKNRAEGVEATLNTAIQNEVSRATNAEGTIADDLSDEVTRATNAESDLETAITNETTRATTAEQANATAISNHIADKGNPHEVTKAQVGLGNVDNTSDLDKPISIAVSNAFDAVEAEINTINSKIPSAASSSNQLADKGFVNSSISTNTANFIGTFNSVAELESYSGTLTNNDYAFVIVTDSLGNTAYDRYKYTTATTPASWLFEYELNNSSFTASQWDSINSTATVDKINQIATNTGNITTLGLTKQDNITSTNKLASDLVDDSDQTNKFVTASEKAQISTNESNITSLQSGKADKATTLSGYGITNAYTKTEVDTALSGKQNTISDLPTILSNATAGKSASDTIATYGNIVTHNTSEFATSAQGALADTAVQPSDLAEVATSGDYDDLVNKPTIPAAQVNSDWNANSGVAEILNKPTLGTMAAESASDYTKTSGLATVATSGNYNDLSNKPTIPTVNNATLTIQKNSTDVATFTANASSNVTADISVPTKVSDLNNDSGFISGITSSDVITALGYTPYNSSNPSGYQTNVIETVKVNGTALTPTNKAVNISVPTVTSTYSATGTDAVNGTAVASAISSKLSVSDQGDILPNFDAMPVLQTIEFNTSDSNWHTICTRNNTETNPKDVVDCVYFRITVTGTNINQVADCALIMKGQANSNPTLLINYMPGTSDAQYGGFRYIREIYPKALNNGYKWALEVLQNRNNNARHYKIQVFKTNSNYTWTQGTASTFNSTYHNAAQYGAETASGYFISYLNGTVGQASNASGINDRLSKVLNTNFPAGEALLANQFVYMNNNKHYPATNKTLAIEPGYGIQFNNTAYNVNNDVGWDRLIQKQRVTSLTNIPHATLARGNPCYFRCRMDSNGNILSDNYVATSMANGYTWYYVGVAESSTAITIDTTQSFFITLDSDGKVTHVNGKSIAGGASWGSITGTLSNQTDLNNALSSKVSTSDLATVHVVVDTYENGTSWYRVYDDGWVEQGGACTLGTFSYSFIKEYISRPNVQLTRMSTYGSACNAKDVGFNAIPTTTGFTLNSAFTSSYFLGADWYACGQGA